MFVQNAFLSLTLDEKVPCVIQHWQQCYMSSIELRRCLGIMVEYYSQDSSHSTTLGLLIDTTQFGVNAPSDIDWIAREVIPALYAKGLRAMAVIAPKDVFGRAGIHKLVSSSGKYNEDLAGFSLQYFKEVDLASEWLKQSSLENKFAALV